MKDIKGYEGRYAITQNGRVWSCKYKRWLKSHTTKKGDWYYSIRLGRKKGFKIHRLVAQAYIPNPLNLPEVNHKNGIKGDNRIKNLEWCSRKQNLDHGFKILPTSKRKYLRGENGIWSKLTQKQAEEIRKRYSRKKSRYSTDVSTRKLAIEYNVSFPTIGDIIRNKRYL